MTEVVPLQTMEEKVKAINETTQILKQSQDEEGIYDIPDHPKMDYEEIFGEPRAYKEKGLGIHLHQGLTKVFGGAFNYTQSTLYYILVMITGLFLGFAWGLMFGTVIYFINWVIHPMYKLVMIFLRLAGVLIRPTVRMALDPFFQSIGQCFGGIRAAFGINLKGLNVTLNKSADDNDMHKV